MERKLLALGIALIIVTTSLGVYFLFLNEDDDECIVADGNNGLIELAHRRGFEGTGTKDDPIIIDDISLSIRNNETAFSISNTTLHLMIIDLRIEGVEFILENQPRPIGIYLKNVSNVTIVQANITDCMYAAKMEDCHNISIGDSYFQSYGDRFWGGDWPCSLKVVRTSDLSVNDSIFNGRLMIDGGKNLSIDGNQVGSCTDALVLQGSSNVDICNNTMNARYNSCAVILSTDVICSNNSLSSYMGKTLLIRDSTQCTLTRFDINCHTSTCIGIEGSVEIRIENTSCNNPLGRALEMSVSRGIEIVNLTASGFDGLFIEKCSDSTLENMVFTSIQYNFVINDCSNCSFLDNVVTSTTHGLNFYRCSMCTFRGNEVNGHVETYWYGTDYLVSLMNCEGMMMTENLFIDIYPSDSFKALCFDDASGNYWNDTESGNYWSNYDGIGPYPIDGAAGAFDMRASSVIL